MQALLRTDLDGPFPAEAVANRLAAAGHPVGVAGGAGEPWSFTAPAAALARLGVDSAACDHGATACAGPLIKLPRIVIFRGRGASYPYYAYYAHSLAALGYDFSIADGPEIAGGRLDDADIFVLPGGFAIWGLDRCEGIVGADQAVRRFLARGGGAIGSCGGAFYLSSGRPGWLGIADASPRYTHEYLRGGAGVVSVEMAPGPLAAGAAPCVEMPYYHGPVYQSVRSGCEIAGRFASLSLAARLPIDNPLDEARFSAVMSGRPAILTVEGKAGRAVLFSPHPEMGDLVRKYVALQSYVERYLPIRGSRVMEETLDFYRPNNAPALRLLFNAIRFVAPSPAGTDGSRAKRLPEEGGEAAALAALVADELDALTLPQEGIGALVARERKKLLRLAKHLAGDPPASLDQATRTLLSDASSFLRDPPPAGQPAAQRLLDLELPLRFLEAIGHRDALDSALLAPEPAT